MSDITSAVEQDQIAESLLDAPIVSEGPSARGIPSVQDLNTDRGARYDAEEQLQEQFDDPYHGLDGKDLVELTEAQQAQQEEQEPEAEQQAPQQLTSQQYMENVANFTKSCIHPDVANAFAQQLSSVSTPQQFMETIATFGAILVDSVMPMWMEAYQAGQGRQGQRQSAPQQQSQPRAPQSGRTRSQGRSQFRTNNDIFDGEAMELYQRQHGRL